MLKWRHVLRALRPFAMYQSIHFSRRFPSHDNSTPTDDSSLAFGMMAPRTRMLEPEYRFSLRTFTALAGVRHLSERDQP